MLHYLCNEKPWFGDPGSQAHALWRLFASEVAGVTSCELAWTISRDLIRIRMTDSAAGMIHAIFKLKAWVQSTLHKTSPSDANQWAIHYWAARYAERHTRQKRRVNLEQYLKIRRSEWRLAIASRQSRQTQTT